MLPNAKAGVQQVKRAGGGLEGWRPEGFGRFVPTDLESFSPPLYNSPLLALCYYADERRAEVATKLTGGAKASGGAAGSKDVSKDVYLRLPEGLKARLRALTDRSHRSLNMEAVVAIEAWVNNQESLTGRKKEGR
jgi:hypothetical protein